MHYVFNKNGTSWTWQDTKLFLIFKILRIFSHKIYPKIKWQVYVLVDGTDNSYINPMFINSGNNLQEYSGTNFKSLLQGWIRKTAADSTDGYKITYSLGASGAGQTRGSGMSDTRLNGSGNYQTRQVNDDYRAQEFPDGTPTSINTYYLRINKS